MNQFKNLFASLSLKQQISLAIVAIAVVSGLYAAAHWNKERDFKPLFSGLSQEDAAAVVAKVRESGSEFRLSESGSTVLVPSAKVAETRLQLAAMGIPKSGRIGFELFDKTSFGVSDFTEQINYHRALEGELERTIMALAEVEQSRAHVTFPKDSVFLESKLPAKASVLIKLKPGAHLSAQNVAAICQLISSAVDGLAPEAVAVVDMRGTLLSRPRKAASGDGVEPDDAVLEFREKIERDLVAKINTTLEPLLGADKYRAGVSVECDFTSGEQSEETLDPTKSVMVSSQKTEDISGSNSASGVPGTASNLPRPTSKPGSGGNSVTRRTENVAYQSSRTVRKLRLPQGTMKRMSVSVLVDNLVRMEGTGVKAKRILEPPPPERMKAIHDLVAGAVGLNAERGDQLVVESQAFEATRNPEPVTLSAPQGTAPSNLPPWLQKVLSNRLFVVGGVAGGVVFMLLIGAALFVFGRRKKALPTTSLPQLEAAEAVDPGVLLTKKLEAQLTEQAETRERQEVEAMSALKLPKITTKKAEVLTRHIHDETKKDPQAMAQILRTWISDEEK